MNGLNLKFAGGNSMIKAFQEKLIEQKVTYSLFKDGKFYLIENVPARVNLETGEQFFSPKTVEQLQQIILGDRKPVKLVQTPVFEFC
jgi:hypothetical protein